jgi:hypothetical protein
MFADRQKVVFIGFAPGKRYDQECNYPALNEVVAIRHKCLECADCGHYKIDEYPNDKCGGEQLISDTQLRPLSEISAELTEEIERKLFSPVRELTT